MSAMGVFRQLDVMGHHGIDPRSPIPPFFRVGDDTPGTTGTPLPAEWALDNQLTVQDRQFINGQATRRAYGDGEGRERRRGV